MAIEFATERWAQVKDNHRRWWAGELKRPLIHVVLGGGDPGRPAPRLKAERFTAAYDFAVPAEEIVDRWDYDLSCQRFLGDAFPHVWPNFGPGVGAAFAGAVLEVAPETCWFHPPKAVEIGDRLFRYSARNRWYTRVRDLYRAAVARWQGLVQVGMTDLGGNLDLLSTFRPGEKLLLDLYDHPAAVKAQTWKAHELWWRCFNEINAVLQPVNPGYTCWTPIFSAEPYYMLQCDFCYMIGPAMFDEFVKPELAATCRRLTNAFYHLDGPGELPHLDSLLQIPELKGIQWIPGAGQKPNTEWPDVYRRIRRAGKLVQIFGAGSLDALDVIADQVGSAAGIVMIAWMDVKKEAEARRVLARYGAL